MNRKIRRHIEKKVGKKASNNFAQKISQFERLPEQCTTCQNSFDKKNKDMVQSWQVVVRQETIRLFCPECIEKVYEAIKQVEDKNVSTKII
jgi:ribosome-associated translation inhibitor RaiA